MKRIACICSAALFMLIANAQTGIKKNTSTHKVLSTSKQSSVAVANGYSIPVTITPFKNTWVYLGCYYGKYKNLVDSAWFNEKSEGVFKGKEKLPGGIYFLVSPNKSILFEIMMDAEQHFTVKADTTHLENAVITGSSDNALFATYTKYLQQKVPQLNGLQQSLKQARTTADSTKIIAALKQVNGLLNDYRENVIKTNPKSILAMLFQAVKRPEVHELKPGEPYPVYFVKNHFWDGVAFADDRLLRTPFFDPKLEEYFKYYVSPEPDSIIAEANFMLLSAREGKEMFKYLLGKFTDKYINPEIMGQDKVFLFLFNNFYSKGDTSWLTAKQKEYIFNRAYSLITNQIGETAPALDLIDSNGKTSSLYNIQAPFTFIVFWDPNCGHCKIEVPRIDSIYKAKWKTQAVKIYAVNTAESAIEAWKQFIVDQHIEGWWHVYQDKQQRLEEEKNKKSNYRQLYDVFQTPTMYLLDANKHIIAKKLSLEQFDELIDAKLKSQGATSPK